MPELVAVEGLGEAGAAALKTIRAAALRLLRADLEGRPLLSSWTALEEYVAAKLALERAERFVVLFLDARNRLIADEELGRGTVDHAPVYPREVARRCLELDATAVVLVHNHPSGDPAPSREDIAMTRRVRDALAPLGVVLHDHLVVASGGGASFRRLGLLAS